MTSQVCIQINNLTKRYFASKEESLKQVSITINSGEKFGILGPNGAGKTTLISIICGIIQSTGGSIKYFEQGNEVNLKTFRKKTGFVPQEYAFYEELTPNQNLEYFGALYNLSKKEINSRTKKLLFLLGLSKVSDKKLQTFSGGMKRRINLAIGIIHKPTILFLDEPTVGVDVQSKNAIIGFLNELNKEGTTIIYTSHHMSEAEEFCNYIALLDNGKLIACDSLTNLLNLHESSSLKSLFINLTGEDYRDNV
ncbi:MAG: ABC transporter ATP-binding protein [Bacteroidales bacterium]|nr:ABC transporter ATP-binding protein [Bacteroidales bacterium]